MEPWELYAQQGGQPDQKQPEPWELYGAAADTAATSDPNSMLNIAKRGAINVVTGIPDFVATAGNLLLNPFGQLQTDTKNFDPAKPLFAGLPTAAPAVRQATGTPEMGTNAGFGQKVLETAIPVAATGGAQAVARGVKAAPSLASAAYDAVMNTGRNIIAPSVGATVGGDVGSKVDVALGGTGEKGGFIGGAIGGVAPSTVPRLATRAVENYYGTQARGDAPQIAEAAARQGVTPTAGMLGNEIIQGTENRASGQRGGTAVINARERALVQMREAADRAAAARGSTDPQPTPGTIGQSVVDTADQTAQNLRQRSSDVQQSMYDRIGNAPVNIAQTYAALRSEIASTDSITARPMQARLAALEDMMPRDRNGTVVVGPGGEINVPLGAFKDWRGGLGKQTQTLEAVPGGHLDKIYGPATDAMRETAISEGVSPAEFDMTQGVTRGLIGSGGPVNYFEKISGKEGTSGGQVGGMSPEGAFSHVVKGGEQTPQRLQQFEQHADPAALSQIAGDTLRLRAQTSLGSGGTGGTGAPVEGVRGGGAAGARNFANWWANMTPEARRILGGNVQPSMEDLHRLASAYNYPTRQTGLNRAIGGQSEGLATRIVGADALGSLFQSVGLPNWLGKGVGMYGLIPGVRSIRSHLLESDAARRGFTGERSPVAPNMSELIAAINAANVASQRRQPQQQDQ